MEQQYGRGLGIQNRYGLLMDDDGSKDPLTTINETPKTKKKRAKPKAATDNVVNITEQTKVAGMPQASRKNKTEPNKGGVNKSLTQLTKPLATGAASLPIEDAVRQLTLDEYKEIAAHRIIRKAPLYNLRQPGEGEDQTQWEKLVPLDKKKHDGDEDNVSKEVCAADTSARQRAARLKRLPMELTFQDRIGRRHRREPTAAAEAFSTAEPTRCWQHPPSVNNKKEFPFL